MGHAAPVGRPALLHIVGCANSGKTTLIERLLPELRAHGLKVATIKHAHHRLDLDIPGKDSWRHRQAGAMATLLVGPAQMQLICDAPAHAGTAELAARFLDDADLVLVEGYSGMTGMKGAKIEVRRKEAEGRPRAQDGLIAMATDDAALQAGVPQLDLNDARAIAGFIVRWMHGADVRPD